ncbi:MULTISPECIES: inorganic diphosphatase [Ramlibacter]|uniref:inorganic diphosphatase n=1 Tax=Ramlibacter aquaticus TaxID=2780094 RepID=A0ABR9SHJ3_9BURK|nr:MULTISPECIES: inorganic diphosphatase [Ramlibacter]MBE7941830.1 inorganic diphosphatase [Ramlibacter aquaticus]
MDAPVFLNTLPTLDRHGAVRVVVEASAGSRSKFKYDPASGCLVLHHVVPPGSCFPLDFGFIPSTLGAGGDPLDALVFADEPLPVGTVLPCRLLGVLQAEQVQGPGPPRRNDRFLLVPTASLAYAPWRDLGDIPPAVLEGLETFFVSYNAQRGVRFRPLGRRDAAAAQALLAAGP